MGDLQESLARRSDSLSSRTARGTSKTQSQNNQMKNGFMSFHVVIWSSKVRVGYCSLTLGTKRSLEMLTSLISLN